MWTNQPNQSIYIRSSQVVNAAGNQLGQVLAAVYGGLAHLDHYQDVGLVGRLNEATLREIEALGADSSLKGYDPTTLLGVHASRALKPYITSPDQCAVIMGSSRGNTQSFEQQFRLFLEGKPVAVTASPATTLGSLAAAVARDAGLGGMQLSVSSACSTSLQAIVVGSALLGSGVADRVVAGGCEFATTPFTLAMLRRIRIYHRDNVQAYYPFHPERGGMVLGDGAAVHLLTTEKDNAQAEILAVGSQGERSTLTGLSATGDALVAACRAALARAQLDVSDVSAIIAHGAGTRRGDAAELAAYSRIFESNLPPITSDKWCFGHTLGAASATSLALAVEVSRRGQLPTMPRATSLPPMVGRGGTIKPGSVVLVTALGFGGGAAAVLVRAL